jgi:SNF2 family DNA or RNA helicase
MWILPKSELENVLKLISGCEYKVVYETTENKDSVEIPDWYEFKTNPFDHQKDAVKYGLKHSKFLLADEQGLGKSKSVLDLSCILKKQDNIKHVLIVACVNGLKYNWMNEVSTHTNESGYILGTRISKKGKESIGSNEDRLSDIMSLGNNETIDKNYYLITNIETLRYNKIEKIPLKTKKNGVQRFKKQTRYPIVEALQEKIKDGQISMIICDEIHQCKNASSLQATALSSLDCKYKVALTGTPIMNKPVDAYIPLHWLGYELHSYYSFEKHYCIKGGFGQHQIVGYRNLPDLQNMLDKCMLRRLKSEVLDLPEKIYINDYVEMSSSQYKLYDDVLNTIIADIDRIKLSPNPLTMLIRLRQVTGNPSLLSSKVSSNPKFDRMLELVDEVVQNNGKCIVFSNWTNIINPAFDLLAKEGYKPAKYTGENVKEREAEKDRFMNDDSCKVILGTIDAMGTGLTLTAANTVIFLDEPWNRAKKDQCEDRAHRIGTTSSPNIITIMCKGTIDERINNIVYKKGKLSDIIVDKEEDILSNPKLLNYLLALD